MISGLFFDSDIPIRYGIGSSGALVAAIYGAYFDQSNEKPIELLIKSLGLIESHFHKYSSGIDPLVSFLSKSIHIANLTPQVVTFNLDWIRDNFGLFLIDTGMSASTRKGIDRNRKEIQHEEYTPLNNSIIQKILSQNDNNLFQDFMRLSYLQSLHFQDLFPPEILNLCKEGHSNSEYAIKLCGSGGGGYFFLISPQTNQIPDNIIHSFRFFNYPSVNKKSFKMLHLKNYGSEYSILGKSLTYPDWIKRNGINWILSQSGW